MVIAANWWNPVSWLQNVAGFFHGAYDAGGAVLNVLGGALTILTQFFRFFFDTGHFIADAVNWLTNALFPPELQTWFLGTIGEPGQQWDSAQIYESLYHAMIAPRLNDCDRRSGWTHHQGAGGSSNRLNGYSSVRPAALSPRGRGNRCSGHLGECRIRCRCLVR